MKQNQRKRKKKQKSPAASNPAAAVPAPKVGAETHVPASVAEAFGLISLEEAREDAETSAEVLRAYVLHNAEDPSTSSSSSAITGSDFGIASSSDSGWSEGLTDVVNESPSKAYNKPKKLVAATGTVSTVLGKDYMKASPRKEAAKVNVIGSRALGNDAEKAEQFLCGMLGDESELGLGVVRDVLCQCGYNVDQALDVLLDMSGSSNEQLRRKSTLTDDMNSGEYTRFAMNSDENLADRASECTSNSYETEVQDSLWFMNSLYRNYSEALAGSETQCATSGRQIDTNVSQEVLESFYKIYKSPQHEPRTMNWRNIAKKMGSLTSGSDVCHSTIEPPKGDEYTVFRKEAQQHWDSMKNSYQKAASAYSKGERAYATYLSEQGKKYSVMGQKADEKASQEIFRARNKDIENIITIDLHGQHVNQAKKLLKFHLLLPSITKLRVITGCGSHGAGKSKLKQMVIRLMETEGIEWSEENQGTLLIKLNGFRDFNFLDSDSNSD